MRNVQIATPRHQVHIARPNAERRPVSDLMVQIKANDHGSCEVHGKTVLDAALGRQIADWSKADPELCDQDETVEDEADPRTDQ